METDFATAEFANVFYPDSEGFSLPRMLECMLWWLQGVYCAGLSVIQRWVCYVTAATNPVFLFFAANYQLL